MFPVIQGFKHQFNTLVAPFPMQLTANVPGKVALNGSRAWTFVACMGKPSGVLGLHALTSSNHSGYGCFAGDEPTNRLYFSPSILSLSPHQRTPLSLPFK